MRPKKVIGEWQVVAIADSDFQRMERGWYSVQLGVLKLTSLPEQGVNLSKQNYKGFLWRFKMFVPFEKA